MRRVRNFILPLVCLGLLAGFLSVPAAAADGDERFVDKTWDEVVSDFLTENEIDPGRVSMGYYNTVTGEEYYLDGDTYRVAGSMYKVALNMYWSEKVYTGEITWDELVLGVPYKDVEYWSIVNSDNDFSAALFEKIGTYEEYRRAVAPFYGVNPDTVDKKYYENNYSTARQILTCLHTLYTDPDRYPNVLDYMLQAEPGKYFKCQETRFDIAQKYGYLSDDTGTVIDTCAIVYTEDPILIVMFTYNVGRAEDRLGQFCSLMCDYAQYHTALRQEEEQAAAQKAAAAAAQKAAATAAQKAQAEQAAAAAEKAEELAAAQARESAARDAQAQARAQAQEAYDRAQAALQAAPAAGAGGGWGYLAVMGAGVLALAALAVRRGLRRRKGAARP